MSVWRVEHSPREATRHAHSVCVDVQSSRGPLRSR